MMAIEKAITLNYLQILSWAAAMLLAGHAACAAGAGKVAPPGQLDLPANFVPQLTDFTKPFIPILEKCAEYFVRTYEDKKTGAALAGEVRTAIKTIQGAEKPKWEMTSISEFIK